LHWLSWHTTLGSIDAIRAERDIRDRNGWEQPQLGEAEAVDYAALKADRFQRQFLRMMKCYHDGRRLIASMTVLGGQVNVAEQQFVADGVPRSQRAGAGESRAQVVSRRCRTFRDRNAKFPA
jgi:hypothetical protein